MRAIKEIYIHCTATEYGRDFSTTEITQWFRSRGWSVAGYHFIIHLDGRIEKLVPISQVSNGVKGHNAHSINIAYIGGLYNKLPFDTRTPEQKSSIIKLVSRLCADFGLTLTSVHGHNEVANKACPCFDVRREVRQWQNLIGAS